MSRLRLALLSVLFVGTSVAPAFASPFVITGSNNAAALVALLVGGAPGITVVAGSETYTGFNGAGGSFTGGTGIIPFDAGGILTSGLATIAAGPNSSGDAGANNRTPGDADLNALVGGTTSDAAILEFDFIPTAGTVSFQYVFGSEEYNGDVVSDFNDVIGFFLNGSNIALIGAQPVAINNVNCYSNSSYFTSNNNEADNLNRPSCGNAGLNTQYDGLAGANPGFLLFAVGSVNPGVTNHIKLAIADTQDRLLDSGVFLKAGGFINEPPSQVPEPTSLALFGSGITLVARRLRRNRRA